MTDVEIINRCLAGEVAGFREIVERYYKTIVGMAYNMTLDHHLSEDLAQDVFLEAYRHLRSFDPGRAKFSTWLYRIARNKTLNALRRKRPVFMSDLPEKNAGTADGYHDISLAELHEDFDRALAALPDNQRIAFVWAEIEQLTYEEIADIEGATVYAVKSRINRARSSIQEALQQRRSSFDEHL